MLFWCHDNAQLTTVSYLVLGIGAQMLKYRPNINPIKSIRLEAYQMSTMKKRILYISHQNKGEQIAVERTFHSHEYI